MDRLCDVLQSFCHIFHALLRLRGVMASQLRQSFEDAPDLVLKQRHSLGPQGRVLASRSPPRLTPTHSKAETWAYPRQASLPPCNFALDRTTDRVLAQVNSCGWVSRG